jgi:hypothetical protein
MSSALIYSSKFDGHRQMFVYVITHILNKMGYKLFIAGNFSANLNNTFYIDKIDENFDVIKIDTNIFGDGGMNISNSDFLNLQIKYDIDLTVFAEADSHISLFNSQLIPKNRKFRGKVIGLFLRPWYIYYKLDLKSKLRYLQHLPNIWKSDPRLFHELLNRTLNLLDSSICIDEFFVSKHKKYIWVPDVFQQSIERLVIEEKSDQISWIERLDMFKNTNKSRFIILYFGTAQQRRGYDLLLKLAVEQGACFVHCGLRDENEKYGYDIEEFRKILSTENRLFETNQYITDKVCIEYFFKSVSHLILPYSNFTGSSGIMLQALSYGIPVLVPDFGLCGYRVKKFNLGLTYKEDSLEEQFLRFVEIPKEDFEDSIGKYIKFNSADILEDALLNAFAGLRSKSLHH